MKLYRGVDDKVLDGENINRYIKTPRLPLHSSTEVHLTADHWFENKFGIKARSQTIFCTPDIGQALEYSGENGRVVEIITSGRDICYFIFSENVDDFNEYVGELKEFPSESEVEEWLEGKDYQMVNCVSKLPKRFKGEVMLFCVKFMVASI